MSDVLLDKQAITRQMAQYVFTFDAHDVEGWVGLFADDGVFEVRIGDTPFVRLSGTEELRGFVASSPPVLHHITSFVFDELLADSARTRAVALGTWSSPRDGSPEIFTHGTYDVRWTRDEVTWRIAHLLFVSLGYSSTIGSPAAMAP